ncbi:MAG: aminoacyl-histidine dipeptidase [Lachnospiraceae bacterium]|nr:aminoacyl-histidine dipeptidase [Lachnospiraceae bacterium]
MGVLNELKPEDVFHYFEEICGIPRGSYQMEGIGDYLVSFAAARNLRCRRDEAGNVIIWKDASVGYEAAEPVILQGHMDMVAVTADGVTKNMQKEGLELEVCGDQIQAKGTSLGGDDGIALACALAILDDDSIPHPPLEAVFTANEEVGLQGAAALDVSDLKGHILLNMDSEEEGVFTVGCAGGATAVCTLPCEKEETESEALKVRVGGLVGGHSGTEIHKGRANANILLGRLLAALREKAVFRLVSMNGGEKDNAIAVSAEATIALKAEDMAGAESYLQDYFGELREEYASTDPDMSLAVTAETSQKRSVLIQKATDRAVMLLRFAPDGVESMNQENPDLVQTSLNLGVLQTESDCVKLTFLARSLKENEKQELCGRIRLLVETIGGKMEITADYPGWEYQPESRLCKVMKEVYREQRGEEPRIEGVHAGLECGIFASKIPGLDAVSFGPQMSGIHTAKEKLSISSVQRTWELLLGTLKALG